MPQHIEWRGELNENVFYCGKCLEFSTTDSSPLICVEAAVCTVSCRRGLLCETALKHNKKKEVFCCAAGGIAPSVECTSEWFQLGNQRAGNVGHFCYVLSGGNTSSR